MEPRLLPGLAWGKRKIIRFPCLLSPLWELSLVLLMELSETSWNRLVSHGIEMGLIIGPEMSLLWD